MLERNHRLIYHTAEQGSLEWHETRAGKVTGTKAAVLLSNPSRGRGGLSMGCWSLIYALASEIAFPDPPDPDPYQSGDMDRGSRLEPQAREAYELEKFTPVKEVGFVEVEGRLAGFSADGVIPPSEGTEIKCLKKAQHMRWLEERSVPKEHHAQIQWTIFCAGF